MPNLARIGQFVEIPDEAVVTMDYGVWGVQWAVSRLLVFDRKWRKSKRNSVRHNLDD
ncbi:hypothetical protein EYZ11_000731 [Aspergillus tanneri]|uniref:Uncharacterized protein n=1 Tax=Aspergillus tanneri TaxID=1220188 RepID=A0A4S3JWF2_9EURO|nr:hypothetical protein EYZ11_000731 [Aspergillus tanneri]